MAEESSFEFINERSEGLESSDNESNNAKSGNSQLRNVKPDSVSVSTSRPDFHQSSFSPEIPEDKNTTSVASQQPVEDDSYGAMGLLEWVKGTVGTKGTDILSKVAEQAKKSVDSVITTLDPQIYSGDSKPNKFELIVLSEKEIEISPIREAFVRTVGRNLDIRGVDVDVEVAKQIVGFDAATKIANAKIQSFKQGKSTVDRFVVVQNFIVEIQKDKWFDLDLLMLADLEKGLRLETYSQMIPIPATIINVAKGDTPLDYKYMEDGLAVTVASLMASNLQVHPSEWQEELTLVSRRKRILNAAIALANLYNNTLF